MSHSRRLLDAVTGCRGVGVCRRGLSAEKHERRDVYIQYSMLIAKPRVQEIVVFRSKTLYWKKKHFKTSVYTFLEKRCVVTAKIIKP